MTLDHSLIRASHVCPFCSKAKDAGLVACWPCYRSNDLRNGGGQQTLDVTEAALLAPRGTSPDVAGHIFNHA